MTAFRKWPKLATIQRLQPLQNGHFRSKIKNAQKHAKNDSTPTLDLFSACKRQLQKLANIKKMTAFRKWLKLATMQRL